MDQIRQQASDLKGDFDWPVPIFSAAKINGKKLYEYGRSETPIELPIKRMSFSDVTIHAVDQTSIDVELRCSKGSFVRTWCSELGDRLGVGGHLEELCRLTVGPYSLTQSVTLDALERDSTAMGEAFIPMSKTLPDWRAVRVAAKEERLLLNGQIPRDLANRLIVDQKEALRIGAPIGVKVLSGEGALISILVAEPGRPLKIRRVFRLDPGPISQ